MDSRSQTDRPLRVLFVEANEDGSVGGSHRVLYDMVQAFSPRDVKPFVLFYQHNVFANRFRDLGTQVFVWEDIRRGERSRAIADSAFHKSANLIASVASRFRFLREHRIDLIHLNNSPRTGHLDWLPAARLARIPIVSSARGDAAPIPLPGLRGALHRWLARRMDRVLAVSEYISQAYRDQGFPPENVITVHDGVRSGLLEWIPDRHRDEVRQEFGIPEGSAMIVMVGNVREWKGQHVVLNALALLDPAIRSQLCVVFVGGFRDEDEAYRNRLTQDVARLGLEPSVIFAGSRDDVPDIVTAADFVLHASVIPEPGGTVVIEAMALGKTVICAEKGGQVDYLLPGIGLLHDVTRPSSLAEAIEDLITHPEKCLEMGKRGRLRAREFSIERTARAVEAVYKDIRRFR